MIQNFGDQLALFKTIEPTLVDNFRVYNNTFNKVVDYIEDEDGFCTIKYHPWSDNLKEKVVHYNLVEYKNYQDQFHYYSFYKQKKAIYLSQMVLFINYKGQELELMVLVLSDSEKGLYFNIHNYVSEFEDFTPNLAKDENIDFLSFLKLMLF